MTEIEESASPSCEIRISKNWNFDWEENEIKYRKEWEVVKFSTSNRFERWDFILYSVFKQWIEGVHLFFINSWESNENKFLWNWCGKIQHTEETEEKVVRDGKVDLVDLSFWSFEWDLKFYRSLHFIDLQSLWSAVPENESFTVRHSETSNIQTVILIACEFLHFQLAALLRRDEQLAALVVVQNEEGISVGIEVNLTGIPVESESLLLCEFPVDHQEFAQTAVPWRAPDPVGSFPIPDGHGI